MTTVEARLSAESPPTHVPGRDVALQRVQRPLTGFCAGMARGEGGSPKVTPLRSIRRFCLWCCCNSSNEVTHCPATGCALWEYRAGHRPQQAILTPLRALRAKCLDCTSTSAEVRRCANDDCTLYVYRTGHRPKGE
jgi:hypothetical protein